MNDDLTKISGIGPATAEKLAGRGVTTFAQLAALTDDQILQLNEELDLRDIPLNNDWRLQAKSLMIRDPDGNPPSTDAPKSSTEKLIPVRINRDFWDADGKRHRKGTVVEVPVEAALDGVETGALSRVKG
ncbi:MAG TPA: helix-hairpin-helix domain-containing protein [Pararhizobium sp.]|nr:helix-hairpin-helix domain-containing protein [Pararhizobium sp.]